MKLKLGTPSVVSDIFALSHRQGGEAIHVLKRLHEGLVAPPPEVPPNKADTDRRFGDAFFFGPTSSKTMSTFEKQISTKIGTWVNLHQKKRPTGSHMAIINAISYGICPMGHT